MGEEDYQFGSLHGAFNLEILPFLLVALFQTFTISSLPSSSYSLSLLYSYYCPFSARLVTRTYIRWDPPDALKA
jgi:hypothetical protein